MTKEIRISNGMVVTVDDCDYADLSRYRWTAFRAGGSWYAKRWSGTSKRTVTYLHRQIMQPPDGMVVDHIDGDGLNNARANLRLANKSQNATNSKLRKTNTSGFRGVSRYFRDPKKWLVQIKVDGKVIRGGIFGDVLDAAKAADRLMTLHHGAYAVLNFPTGAATC